MEQHVCKIKDLLIFSVKILSSSSSLGSSFLLLKSKQNTYKTQTHNQWKEFLQVDADFVSSNDQLNLDLKLCASCIS